MLAPNRDLLLMASILALLRGEMTVRGVAERFGVTEAQVARWRDIFEIAGTLALSSVLSGQSGGPRAQRRPGGKAQRSDPTTNAFGDPTTPTQEPAATTLGLQSGGKAKSKSKKKKRSKRTKSKSKR